MRMQWNVLTQHQTHPNLNLLHPNRLIAANASEPPVAVFKYQPLTCLKQTGSHHGTLPQTRKNQRFLKNT
jgi:hypothetical protein